MSATSSDLKRQRKDLYQPRADTVMAVEVPEMRFLGIDGAGTPNTALAYKQAVEALYAVAYALKFLRQMIPGTVDSPVLPLEGLWWMPEGLLFSFERKDDWPWTALIRQPDDVTEALFKESRRRVAQKKPLLSLSLLRLGPFHEGPAAQILHLGPYATEGPTIARLHAFIREQGYTFDGRQQKHHEIYLSDPRRTAPDKLRTVIRQPVTRPS